ncbi:Pyridoxamine 5'-phosphate oxidase [Anatilimnocola aggregata]|uniref:Pyridoxamine 5'-phosphate oxidase n=1 Tax=Anatilimnocola aggregata TaxID=2528021 RepID=A0A517Y7N5_9BACT|nr:pyridoxamine 5'-phosphate oxidase family protein [Anatilimnocola aggregata]QDU26249.1 Pyridoxamine 5'-phosphate oxidase [Anatilimnocola aggregata]
MTKLFERQDTIDTLRGLIEGMSVAMLTTLSPEGKLHSRPMIPARHEFDGDVWFFVSGVSPICSEIRQHSAVNVSYATPAKDQFVTLSGTADIVTDRQKLELLWREELRNWFAEGLATPDLVLLRVAVDEAEFWDKQASTGGGFFSSMISWKGTFELVHEKVGWSAADELATETRTVALAAAGAEDAV